MSGETSEARADWERQQDEWRDWEHDSLARGRCPYSGGVLVVHDDGFARCPGVCDCFGIDPADIREAQR